MTCLECEVVAGRKEATGGMVLETERFVVHALLAPSPLRGWVVVASKRHAGWWWELDEGELAELGPLSARVLRAQRSALGAVHGYAFAIGDMLHHMHLHLVPRFADTPPEHKGRAAFDAKTGLLSEEEIARAAALLRAALAAPEK